MRKLTAAVLLLTALAFLAIGPAPRYLEELRIGGGFGEPTDGGADLAANGAIDTDGPIQTRQDLSAGAFDTAADHTLTLRVPDARTAAIDLVETDTTHGGALWFDGALNKLRLGTRDGATPIPALDILRGSADITLQGKLTALGRITATDGVNIGASILGSSGALGIKASAYTGPNSGLRIMHNAASANDYGYSFQSAGTDVLRIGNNGNGTFSGDLTLNGGDMAAGLEGSVRGVVTLLPGGGGVSPGTVKLYSPNGTPWYLFVQDNGTLRIHNALPTSNADGTIVGLQF